MTVNIACEMLVSTFQCIAQPNTTMLDCIMYLCDPDILPGSAYQCILGNMYLRSDLSINQYI